MKDFLIVWFYIDGEMISCTLSQSELNKGTKHVKITDCHNFRRRIDYGYHSLKEIIDVSRFWFEDNFNTRHLMKWEERNKLFEKYSELKNIA